MLVYEVLGNPVPWAASKTNGKIHYDPKHKEKQQIIWQLKSQLNHEPLTGPINFHVTFYMPIPKSASGIRKRQMLNGVIHHICKPDRSNLLKLIEDCAERAGIISNDSIIVGGEAKKMYGLIPKTIIRIEDINHINHHYAEENRCL